MTHQHNSEWAGLSHTVIEYAVSECRHSSAYALAFVLEADILSTGCYKDDVVWHVWLFWETRTVGHVIFCRYSVNHSNVHLIIVLMAQSDTSYFPSYRVLQAHTLGEVGILGTVLLRVYSGTFQFLLKSVHIWQTRSKIYVGTVFLRHGVYVFHALYFCAVNSNFYLC